MSADPITQRDPMSRPNPLIPKTMAQAVAIAKRINASWPRVDALPATPEPVADPEMPTVFTALSTPKPLSTAAQAILDAFWKQPGDRSALAASLRAAAPMMQFVQDHKKLLTIATELEGSDG